MPDGRLGTAAGTVGRGCSSRWTRSAPTGWRSRLLGAARCRGRGSAARVADPGLPTSMVAGLRSPNPIGLAARLRQGVRAPRRARATSGSATWSAAPSRARPGRETRGRGSRATPRPRARERDGSAQPGRGRGRGDARPTSRGRPRDGCQPRRRGGRGRPCGARASSRPHVDAIELNASSPERRVDAPGRPRRRGHGRERPSLDRCPCS